MVKFNILKNIVLKLYIGLLFTSKMSKVVPNDDVLYAVAVLSGGKQLLLLFFFTEQILSC